MRTLLASGRWWSKWKLLRWGAQTTFSSLVTYTERKDGSHLRESARTLKTLAIPSKRLIFQLAVSERPTEESASGLLPTVQTQGLKRCSKEGKDRILPDRAAANTHGTRHGFRKNKQEPKPQCCGTANLGTRRKKRFAACKERQRIKYRKDFWQNFPTQSPVCGGDDGLPFDVDDLAISFPRWRKESIRAYGNAWVPQVAYEIFKAIAEQEGL